MCCFVNLTHQMVCYSEPSEESRLDGDQQGAALGPAGWAGIGWDRLGWQGQWDAPLPPQAQSERAVAGAHEGVTCVTCRTSKRRPVIGPKKHCATVSIHVLILCLSSVSIGCYSCRPEPRRQQRTLTGSSLYFTGSTFFFLNPADCFRSISSERPSSSPPPSTSSSSSSSPPLPSCFSPPSSLW